MKLLTSTLLTFILTIVAVAQQGKPSNPETARLPAEAQQEISGAQRTAQEARVAAEAAASRYETAQQRVLSSIYKAMAELKLSPKEWQIRQDQQGNIYFQRLEPAKGSEGSPPKQPAASPSPPK